MPTGADIEALRVAIDAFRESGESSHRDAEAILERASQQCAGLGHEAKGLYSGAGISGEVWFNGASLVTHLDAFGDELERRGLTELEERARACSVAAACAVMGHYPEQVFPRVLKQGECNERLGRADIAINCYLAIAKDFEQLGEHRELLSHEYLMEELDRVILESVAKTLGRLRELLPAEARVELSKCIRDRLGAV